MFPSSAIASLLFCFPLPPLLFTSASPYLFFPSPLLPFTLCFPSPLLPFTSSSLHLCFPSPQLPFTSASLHLCFPLPLLPLTSSSLNLCFPLPLTHMTSNFLFLCYPWPASLDLAASLNLTLLITYLSLYPLQLLFFISASLYPSFFAILLFANSPFYSYLCFFHNFLLFTSASFYPRFFLHSYSSLPLPLLHLTRLLFASDSLFFYSLYIFFFHHSFSSHLFPFIPASFNIVSLHLCFPLSLLLSILLLSSFLFHCFSSSVLRFTLFPSSLFLNTAAFSSPFPRYITCTPSPLHSLQPALFIIKSPQNALSIVLVHLISVFDFLVVVGNLFGLLYITQIIRRRDAMVSCRPDPQMFYFLFSIFFLPQLLLFTILIPTIGFFPLIPCPILFTFTLIPSSYQVPTLLGGWGCISLSCHCTWGGRGGEEGGEGGRKGKRTAKICS